MFKGFSNSWALVQAAWQVLQQDKELLVFPIVSAFGVVLVSGVFAVPGFLVAASDNPAAQYAGYALAFLFYLVTYTVIFFANAALVGAALIRLRGGDPTLGDGFSIAFSRLGAILGYALISATVGMILQMLSEKNQIGKFVANLLGSAWNIATYLAVPILVVENVGPLEAVKRSVAYLKRTWGEQIVGNAGMGLVFGLLFFAVILAGGAGIFVALSLNLTPLVIGVIAIIVVVLILLALLNATLTGIYTAAVYRFAVEGATESQFPAALVQNTFRAK